jgi:hypothetical protein
MLCKEMENVPFALPVCMIENPHLCVKTSEVDRQRFDVNPDPDPTFFSYLGPDPDASVHNTTAARHFLRIFKLF